MSTSRRVGDGAGIVSFFRVAWQNRALIKELIVRDLKGGYAGHGLGAVWGFVQPMVIVITFMLIFGVVIGARMAVTQSFPGDYTSYILIGVVPWLLTANALGRAPSVFSSSASLVKQVVFPLEALPIASVLACFALFLPAIGAMLAYKLIFGGGLPATTVLLPVVLLLHGLFILGLMLLLSVVTPFVRDVRELVAIYLTVAMYFTPAIYLPDWVPEAIRPILYLNPFSYVVWVYQDTLFFGEIRHGFAWIVLVLMAGAAFVGGLGIFRRIRPFLGNVL